MKSIFTSLGLVLFFLNFSFAQELRLSTSSYFKYDIEIPSGVVFTSNKSIEVFPSGKRVNPPLANLQPDFNSYTVDVSMPKTINTTSGTSIQIPSNAFVDEKGELVKGKVNLLYKELNSAKTIMLSGIPMDSKEGQLESAAMFEIRATQNNTPVFPNPNVPIEILFPFTPIGADFSYYNYDEQLGEWVDRGSESLLSPPLNPQSLWGFRNIYTQTTIHEIPLPSGLRLEALLRKDVKYRGKKRGLQIKITADKQSKSWSSLSFEDLRKLNKINWVYVGDQSRSNLKKVKNRIRKIFAYRSASFSNALSEVDKEKRLMDCWLTADYQNDRFLMHVATLADTLHLPVVPFNHSGDYQEQKQLAKLFLRYETRLLDRKKVWQKKLVQFYSKAEEEIAQNEITTDTQGQAYENLTMPRQVSVSVFGICNIDRIIPRMSKDILVVCENASGEKLKIKSIKICNERVRTVMNFRSSVIQVPSFKKNSMLVKFTDGRVATIDEKDFKRGLNLSRDKATYSVNPIVEKTVEDIYKEFMASNQ